MIKWVIDYVFNRTRVQNMLWKWKKASIDESNGGVLALATIGRTGSQPFFLTWLQRRPKSSKMTWIVKKCSRISILTCGIPCCKMGPIKVEFALVAVWWFRSRKIPVEKISPSKWVNTDRTAIVVDLRIIRPWGPYSLVSVIATKTNRPLPGPHRRRETLAHIRAKVHLLETVTDFRIQGTQCLIVEKVYTRLARDIHLGLRNSQRRTFRNPRSPVSCRDRRYRSKRGRPLRSISCCKAPIQCHTDTKTATISLTIKAGPKNRWGPTVVLLRWLPQRPQPTGLKAR